MRNYSQHGFTLTELLIALLLAAVVLGLGVPAFSGFVLSNRMISQTNDLVSDMAISRSEAVKRSDEVTICIRNAAGTGCAAAATTTWEDGWIVFADTNANATVDANEPIIRTHPELDGNNTARVTNGNVGSFVIFDNEGRPIDINNNVLTATFSICDSRGVGSDAQQNLTARSVLLGASGRVRSSSVQANIACP